MPNFHYIALLDALNLCTLGIHFFLALILPRFSWRMGVFLSIDSRILFYCHKFRYLSNAASATFHLSPHSEFIPIPGLQFRRELSRTPTRDRQRHLVPRSDRRCAFNLGLIAAQFRRAPNKTDCTLSDMGHIASWNQQVISLTSVHYRLKSTCHFLFLNSQLIEFKSFTLV